MLSKFISEAQCVAT